MSAQPEPEFPNTPTPEQPGSMWEGETPAQSDTPRPKRAGKGGASSRPRGTQRRAAKPAAPPGGSTPPPRPTGGASRDLKTRLEELFGGMALIPMAAGDTYSAHIIATRSGHLAEAWADLAKTNPAVKRVLEGMLQGGAWGAVIMSTGAVVVPILGHYGVLPAIDPWGGMYPDSPVPQGDRRPRHAMPPAQPEPSRPQQWTGRGHTPDNPRQNGAGTPAVNSDGTTDMTPPIAAGQPAGVVTVAGSRAAAPTPVDVNLPQQGHTEGGPMTQPIAPGQPAGTVTVAGSRNRAD